MTSSYKEATGNTPPLSSDESTEVKVQQSKRLAKTENTPLNTKSTAESSKPIKLDEQAMRAADMMKIALTMLQKRGLIRQFKLLSEDRTTVREILIRFDNSVWNEDLTLKADNSVVEEEK
jgi:hypothetical protein